MPASERTALSERQTSRLVLYLDQHMLQIQRGFQKRHEPNTQLASLSAFLAAWQPMLEVVSATPLRGSAAALRDAYLLRLTTELTEGIVGYPIRNAPDRFALLTQVLYWTDLLDQLWDARIRRIALPLTDAQHTAHERFPENVPEAVRIEDAESVRPFAQVKGDTDTSIPAYDQTERVRLRDVLSQAEQQLFAWMRDALGAPPPPVQDEEDDDLGGMPRSSVMLPNEAGQDSGEDGNPTYNNDMDNAAPNDGPAAEAVADDIAADADAIRAGAPDTEVPDADAPDTEAGDGRAPLHAPESLAREALTEEQQHYADVFEHKVRGELTQLDPDADDSDTEDGGGAEDESDDADGENPPRKRARHEPSVSVEALGWWDLHYTRAFSRAMHDLRTSA
ncbi:hypothetical protein MBRA1_003112 [Malassezia brasiliensis]|uniref:Uncharacterized protein n=1 Tax=Malassezia brasiliensis TaxID=1821822 RepID=A0AAF0DUB1_9BASI|nr:hypothetical protein MBRA1_003112 [Malassezia brasiliensis]